MRKFAYTTYNKLEATWPTYTRLTHDFNKLPLFNY